MERISTTKSNDGRLIFALFISVIFNLVYCHAQDTTAYVDVSPISFESPQTLNSNVHSSSNNLKFISETRNIGSFYLSKNDSI